MPMIRVENEMGSGQAGLRQASGSNSSLGSLPDGQQPQQQSAAMRLKPELALLSVLEACKSRVLTEEIFKEFDDICHQNPDRINELLEFLGVESDKRLHTLRYKNSASQGNIFFVTLLRDIINKNLVKLDNFNSLYNKLKTKNQFANICMEIFTRQEEILSELKSNSSSSSIRSESDPRLNQIPSAPRCNHILKVYIVYHSDQLKSNDSIFSTFKQKLQGEYAPIEVNLASLELSQIRPKYEETKGRAVFLLYDNYVNSILDENQENQSVDIKAKTFREFYNLVYNEYLEKNQNKRFYLVTMNEFSSYNNNSNRLDFNYKWLLRIKRSPTESTERKIVYSKPFQLGDLSTTNNVELVSSNLDRYMAYLRSDFELCRRF